MEENEFTHNSIKEIMDFIPDNFSILEDKIDLDVQKDFFNSLKDLIINPEDKIEDLISNLNNTDLSVEERKIILLKLSSIDSVEAYRAIEKLYNMPDSEFKEWTALALQQSKLIIQSSLLGEQIVFISTGLGGKNGKLRYYLIFPYSNSTKTLSDFQLKILKEELEFLLSKNNGEVEESDITSRYASFMIILPLKAPIADIVKVIVDECNQYGSFLSEDVLITNMKKFNEEDIISIIEKRMTFED
ncbi:MAG: hypothetical protein KA807_03550 [Prolixibacteraceae bacterium]|nr:hypothetical protein [Prolixibacteraceae bacterium]